MDRWKSIGGKSQRGEMRRIKEVRSSERRKRGKKEDAGARKGRKVASHCVTLSRCARSRGDTNRSEHHTAFNEMKR